MKTCQIFTPDAANKTLPLVKKIVADILEIGANIRAISVEDTSGFDSDPACHRLFGELHELLAELEAIGCVYKDYNFSVGLVDFPAVIDDQEVYLCWRSDEKELQFYHPVEAGYAGRKRIPKEYL